MEKGWFNGQALLWKSGKTPTSLGLNTTSDIPTFPWKCSNCGYVELRSEQKK